MIAYRKTPIGVIGLEETDGAVTRVVFGGKPGGTETSLIRKAFAQLDEYFSGKRQVFELPLNPVGTPFQRKVWDALCGIPYAQTVSYGEIAKRIGNPKASRAVGLANNRNPLSIFIPCHRVIGANGKLVGYGGGLPIKIFLLELERNTIGTEQ